MNYQKIYNQIIERAKTRQIEGYVEKHHIIPKCIGGNNEIENIVQLTPKEHFLCHMLLCEIYPKNPKLWYALFLMSINKNKKEYNKYKISSRMYNNIKLEWSQYSRNRPKPEGFGDKIRSEEKNKKIGIANSKPKPKGFGERHSLKMKGKTKTKEQIENFILKKSKAVAQYDKFNNFIKNWLSPTEAGKALNINPSSISAVARGRINNITAGNYKWKYINNNLK